MPLNDELPTEPKKGRTLTFEEVYRDELEQLNARRRARKRDTVKELVGGVTRPAPGRLADGVLPLTTGLALSGGGIRSAAFSLGVLQALEVGGKFDNLDYISSVSGGGYIASSLAANLYLGHGEFPFVMPDRNNLRDSPAIEHIRDYASYLIPKGVGDLFDFLVGVIRGLVASLSLVVGPLLLAAAFTVFCNPRYADLSNPVLFGISLSDLGLIPGAGLTTLITLIAIVFFFCWAMAKSVKERRDGDGGREFVGPFPRIGRLLVIATLLAAFAEFQPPCIAGLFKLARLVGDGGGGTLIVEGMKWTTSILSPLGAIAAFLSRQLGALANANPSGKDMEQRWSIWVVRISAQIALLVAALSLPLLLWAVYLYLCYWGIEAPGSNPFPQTPQWLLVSASLFGPPSGHIFALLYLAAGLFFVTIISLLTPNANSLHRLYRDRLSSAFLFGPKNPQNTAQRDSLSHDDDEVEIAKRIELSSLANTYAPYPIFNVALNIEGSRYVNKRGRNAEFFILSPLYIGSEATGYAETAKAQVAELDLDLGAAMAISAAAYSPSMGSKTVRLLTPTLALLNIRLGYWLRNPALIQAEGRHAAPASKPFYLFQEMFGLLDETSRQVYLTDGGHIEALGIYELLRRRCGTIIAVDCNEDAEMTFFDFVVLQRYARIDLGIRIELPWQSIRERALATSAEMAAAVNGTDPVRHSGPHAAWGRIFYPGGAEGRLLYIKASLTGDENDYILNYKRRYPIFPHEPTADQFFSEEQFEVYRALGFHEAFKAIEDLDVVASADQSQSVTPERERSGSVNAS
ncbi:patatin-like phospholipase family protein [Bradyrhizobium sp. BRP22]|uniref:patatin-like phospholipase family protein n=1 Tax=Bradyrhizobium sp. BRP22 TaxID=2793821 RepID=UPI001CD5DDBF|nr:patatin-like phospholipase family protein [Bradyrhizobium sp. BRP22]MCA1457613.1 patatin-like phospholipase family protein [Bradyrhizobium sp. BRP22]